MTEPAKRVKHDDDDLTPLERKMAFDHVYKGEVLLGSEDEIFTKNSRELAIENTPYGQYRLELAVREEQFSARQIEFDLAALREQIKLDLAAREEKYQENLAALKFDSARYDFFIRSSEAGDSFDYFLLTEVCEELGSLLFDFLDDENELTKDQKEKIISVVISVFGEGEESENLLKVLHLRQNMLIPRQENGQPYAPSSMNGSIQVEAAEEEINCNFIYAYPFGIPTHFPVFFCHPVFADFMDILHHRNINNPVLIEYQQFMDNNRGGLKPKQIGYLFILLVSLKPFLSE